MLKEDFFTRHPIDCAVELIGCELHWDHCSGIVVETEAYTATGDEACHTFLRRGAQKFVDSHDAGTGYIYLNYGIHWLLNVLIKGNMDGFVLIRALEPRAAQPLMGERRKLDDPLKLCSGPGKLTQALAILPSFHGSSLCYDPRRSFHARPDGDSAPGIVSDVRIGISRAADLPWRFLAEGSHYVSRPPTRSSALYRAAVNITTTTAENKRPGRPQRDNPA